jgi:hypothetical protein
MRKDDFEAAFSAKFKGADGKDLLKTMHGFFHPSKGAGLKPEELIRTIYLSCRGSLHALFSEDKCLVSTRSHVATVEELKRFAKHLKVDVITGTEKPNIIKDLIAKLKVDESRKPAKKATAKKGAPGESDENNNEETAKRKTTTKKTSTKKKATENSGPKKAIVKVAKEEPKPTSRFASKRRWSPEEDEQLLALVAKHGVGDWQKIAAALSNSRTSIAVEQHYNLMSKRTAPDTVETKPAKKPARKPARKPAKKPKKKPPPTADAEVVVTTHTTVTTVTKKQRL